MISKKIFILLVIILSFVFCFNIVLAEGGTGESGDLTTLPNPLPGLTPQTLIGKIINAIIGIVGSLALVMFIYGGFIWMTAAGSAEKVEKGKNVLLWATIGLVVIFTAYALVRFVFTAIGV